MKKAKVFVIMPFTDEFFESYEMLKEHFENEFDFSHAGDEDNQQNILADIISPIYEADVVLADLTGLNLYTSKFYQFLHFVASNRSFANPTDLPFASEYESFGFLPAQKSELLHHNSFQVFRLEQAYMCSKR